MDYLVIVGVGEDRAREERLCHDRRLEIGEPDAAVTDRVAGGPIVVDLRPMEPRLSL